ncbi:serine protease [Oxalobacteraceae bacterium CAVE-383]|nr:serine protease [Oxalobacteraceae bacterium CAVE-383]
MYNKSLGTLAAFALIAISAVHGLPANATPAAIPAVEQHAALQYSMGQAGRPSYLSRTVARYNNPESSIGEVQTGFFCGNTRSVVWNAKVSGVLMSPAVASKRFRTELENAHYPVTTVSDAIFTEQKPVDIQNALQVGVLVKEIGINMCIKDASRTEGEAYLKLFWQVFAPEQQKVIFETTTEGRFSSANVPTPSELVMGAFTAASRNFLAQSGFTAAVTAPYVPNPGIQPAPPAPGVPAAPGASGMPVPAGGVQPAAVANGAAPTVPAIPNLTVDGAAPNGDALTQKMTQLRSAIGTVYGETGSGSGFFIGTAGYMLSNKHVVGNTKFVRVRLATGRDLVGEVVRVDPLRDVALIKTEPPGVYPMAVRASDPGIGEDVYALGSPLGDEFNSTLTKGILSGYRTLNNLRFLQSDVAILPGNSGGALLDKSGQVIGITVAGLGAKGLAGMNFFIPIEDALSKLSVQVKAK